MILNEFIIFSPEIISFPANPWGKILASIKCRRAQNAQLIEEASKEEDRRNARNEMASYLLMFITYWNVNRILFF